MSSNGFLYDIELHGFALAPGWVPQGAITLHCNSAGCWSYWDGSARISVLLLSELCFWAGPVAVLAGHIEGLGIRRIWVWRAWQEPSDWRRARVRLFIGV